MEDNLFLAHSIWGRWWTHNRKWFYSAWLMYETCIRFYEYSLPVYKYCYSKKDSLSETGAQLTAIFCSSLTFATCFFFLTIPATVALFRYFQSHRATSNSIEHKVKSFL